MREARDVMAVLFLERRLAALREQYLATVVSGTVPGPEFLPRGEDAAYRAVVDRFYNADTRAAIWPDGGAPASDEDDFQARTQKLAEFATLSAHRTLQAIPCVGQSDIRDDG